MRANGCARVTVLTLPVLALAAIAAAGVLPTTDSRPPTVPELGATAPFAPRASAGSTPVAAAGHLRAPDGESIGDARVIPALPYATTGTTCGFTDDYDAACDYASNAPDVVYAFTAPVAMRVDIDLCGSSFDTKVFVLDAGANLLYCNEDAYGPGDPCGTYVSRLQGALLAAGETAYIVIDGYGGACGGFVLDVHEYVPCVLSCAGMVEDEPALHDGYVDRFNGGCNSPRENPPLMLLQGDADGALTFCGTSGFYVTGGLDTRDTDWFAATIGPTGVVEWRVDAEQVTVGYVLQLTCPDPGAYGIVVGGACEEDGITIVGEPGTSVGLWIGPPGYTAPLGMDGHEYDYSFTLTGLSPHRAVSVADVSWGSLKSGYR